MFKFCRYRINRLFGRSERRFDDTSVWTRAMRHDLRPVLPHLRPFSGAIWYLATFVGCKSLFTTRHAVTSPENQFLDFGRLLFFFFFYIFNYCLRASRHRDYAWIFFLISHRSATLYFFYEFKCTSIPGAPACSRPNVKTAPYYVTPPTPCGGRKIMENA